jgi:tRNA threonylcarbamoyladenosine biosynthesis protein TsaB
MLLKMFKVLKMIVMSKNKKLLAIDTSTEHFSVCYFDGKNYLEKSILGDAKSSSLVLDMIDEVCGADDFDDVGAIIYTKGPGAFTGVRVGIGVVCGLSLAKNIPTLGFSTLEVLEFGAKEKFNTNKIISSIDARMGEIYLRVDGENKLIKPDDLTEKYTNYIGVGTGFQTYNNFANCKSVVGDFYPQAKNLIKLALNNLGKLSSEVPEPLYLRNDIAKKSTKNL